MVDENLNQKIGQRLNAFMKDRKLRNADLAGLLHVTTTNISKIRNGKVTLRPDYAETIAEKYGVDAAYLLCQTDFETMKDQLQAASQEYTEMQQAGIRLAEGRYEIIRTWSEAERLKLAEKLSQAGFMNDHDSIVRHPEDEDILPPAAFGGTPVHIHEKYFVIRKPHVESFVISKSRFLTILSDCTAMYETIFSTLLHHDKEITIHQIDQVCQIDRIESL